MYLHVFSSREENSVDPDQLASQKPADLDLQCFQNRIHVYLCSVWYGLLNLFLSQGMKFWKLLHSLDEPAHLHSLASHHFRHAQNIEVGNGLHNN